MTRDETKRMIMYLKTAYSTFGEGVNIAELVNVWYDAFADEPVRVMGIAAKNYTKSSEYPPTIAGMQKQIDLIKETETDTELWALITKAAKNSTYGAVEEFEKLPPVCKAFVGSPTNLKDLGQVDQSTLQTVVKSQFVKTVPKIREHKTVQGRLPAEVRMAIEHAKMKQLEREE